MKPQRIWTRQAGGETPYVLDIFGLSSRPQSAFALLSDSRLRCIPSLEQDAFTEMSLLANTPARRITSISSPAKSSANGSSDAVSNLVWSCSADGVIAAWDVLNDSSGPAFVANSPRVPFGAIAVGMEGTLVAVGTDEGVESKTIFWDIRQLNHPLSTFSESHSDSITNLVFSPGETPLLLSGSVDGLVCAFDLLKPTESSALKSVLNANSACSRIGFFGANWEGVYATTHTETLSIFELESCDTICAFEYDLNKGTGCRETLQDLCGGEINYLVDCMWEPKTQKVILLAGHSEGNAFGFEIDLGGFVPLGPLLGCHTDVVRCCHLISLEGRGLAMLTGGEDGKLCFWNVS